MVKEENPFEHILYEFTMYYNSFFLNFDNQLITNFLVDSHLLHLRNIAYFFDKEHQCDLHASKYVNNPEKLLINSKDLKDIYYRTNCAACHMSKERLKPSFKDDTRKCKIAAFNLLNNRILAFIAALDTDIKPEYKEMWLDNRIQEIANSLRERGKNV